MKLYVCKENKETELKAMNGLSDYSVPRSGSAVFILEGV